MGKATLRISAALCGAMSVGIIAAALTYDLWWALVGVGCGAAAAGIMCEEDAND